MEGRNVYLDPEDLDLRMGWRPGRAEQLARQRRLPYVLLPDGSIRFEWSVIESLIVRVQAVATAEGGRGND